MFSLFLGLTDMAVESALPYNRRLCGAMVKLVFNTTRRKCRDEPRHRGLCRPKYLGILRRLSLSGRSSILLWRYNNKIVMLLFCYFHGLLVKPANFHTHPSQNSSQKNYISKQKITWVKWLKMSVRHRHLQWRDIFFIWLLPSDNLNLWGKSSAKEHFEVKVRKKGHY